AAGRTPPRVHQHAPRVRRRRDRAPPPRTVRAARRANRAAGAVAAPFHRPIRAALTAAARPGALQFALTVITGFNTDVKHKSRVFHIQTEDKGDANPCVESLVYVGGEILATKRTSYAE